MRVNCGGDDRKDSKRDFIWLSDKPFVKKGKKYRFAAQPSIKVVEDPAPKDVYQSIRHRNVSYDFSTVPDGIYQVRFHFMDGKTHARRSMEFWVDGERLIQNFHVKESGDDDVRAIIFEDFVEVKGGDGLQLKGSKGRGDDVFISAIEILPAPSGSKPSKAIDPNGKAPSDLAGNLRQFAGGPVRLVWTRTENEDDYYQQDDDGVLFGIDSEDKGGERVILPQLRSYAMPMLTPDGQKVIFTDQRIGKCFEVGFDGSNLRELTDGFASDLWRDPTNNRTWLYVRKGRRTVNSPIIRHDLNDLSVQEVVWKQSPSGIVQASWFTVSGDGQFAADGFPWPQCGIVDLREGNVNFLGKGCWPSVAPDASQKFFYFVGKHTAIEFFDSPQAQPRLVRLATIPGWTGRKLYHPRWTNDVRFITATAPQWMPETELYLGKFDPRFENVESWFRVTYNSSADFFGDAWLAGASQHLAKGLRMTVPITHKSSARAKDVRGLVFVWENEQAQNAILDDQGKVQRVWNCRYDGEARPNRWYGADIRSGGLLPSDDAAPIIGTAISASGKISLTIDLESLAHDENLDGVVASLGNASSGSHFWIEQKGGGYFACIRTTGGDVAKVSVGPVSIGEPVQLIVAYAENKIGVCRNGVEVASVDVKCDLSLWNPTAMVFGRDLDGKRFWKGSMENLRVFDRPITRAEVGEFYQASVARWASRKPASRVVVEAELVEASEPADPEGIAPYTRSLAENLYKVKRVVSGKLADQTIIVLQWVVLGGKTLESSVKNEADVYRLTLDPVEEHPELSGEHRSTDLFENASAVFYDVES